VYDSHHRSPFPGQISLEATKPGFSFFLCLHCVTVYLCSERMFALVALDMVLSVLGTSQEIGWEEC